MPRGRALNGRGARDSTRAGRAAVELRVTGASYAEIATTLALADATEALALVERELASHLDHHSVDIARAEASERILTLLASVWDTATNVADPERLPALRLALALVDRHIRLHGLDRPTEIILHTPTAAELERWVTAVTAQQQPAVTEPDITGYFGAIEATTSNGDDP